jgi:hypothetical protein
MQIQVIAKREILWERWRLEEVCIEGVNGIFQLRDVDTREIMQAADGPALFTSPRSASYSAFLGRAPHRHRYNDSSIKEKE